MSAVTLLPASADLPRAPGDGIRAFIARLRELVVSRDIVRFQRLIIAEAERHPALGQAMHERAIAGGERVLVDYLDACVADRRLPAQDTAVAARVLGLKGSQRCAEIGPAKTRVNPRPEIAGELREVFRLVRELWGEPL